MELHHPFPTLPCLEDHLSWCEVVKNGFIYVEHERAKVSVFGRENHRCLTIVQFTESRSYLCEHPHYRIDLTEGYGNRRSLQALLEEVQFSLARLMSSLKTLPFSEQRFGVRVSDLFGFKVTLRPDDEATVINPFGWHQTTIKTKTNSY